ncbi:MAG: GIY-YIG nuclease family protein [Candidatus Zixiibacteriota bacterium]
MSPYFVYILQSSCSGKFYVGSTADLTDRIQRHNKGRSPATLAGRPWQLVYTEEFSLRTEAVRRELTLKGWKSHDRLAKLIAKGQTSPVG